MAPQSRFRIVLYGLEFALAVFGLYLTLTFFEVWASTPFWLKNLTLAASLVAVYVFARTILPRLGAGRGYVSPAEKSRARFGLGAILHMGAVLSLGLFAWSAVSAGPAWKGRLIQAFTLSLEQPPSEVLLDVTVTPPAFTGSPATTVFSEQDGAFSRFAGGPPLAFPEGSTVSVAISGSGDVTPSVSIGNAWLHAAYSAGGVYRVENVLNEDADLSIQAGPYVSIRQPLAVIPDENPRVSLAGKLQFTKRNSLAVGYSFGDDYGVEELFVEIALPGGNRASAFSSSIPVRKGRNDGQDVYFLNLLDHPLAGSTVNLSLSALDGLGQKGISETVSVQLPEKSFSNPLAGEIAAIRKTLVVSPERASLQINRLERITKNPADFDGHLGVYLALRSAYWRLRSILTQEDLDEVTRFLWQAAVTLEDDGSLEEQDVRTMIDELAADLMGNDIPRFFEKKIDRLESKINAVLRREFQATSRRLSLNTGVGRFESSTLTSFRGYVESVRVKAREGDREAALEALEEARALFETMSF